MTRTTWTLLLLTACGVTETGNPDFDVRLAMRAVSSDPDGVAVAASSPGAVVEAVWTKIDRVRFVTAERCDTGVETEHDLPPPGVTDAAASVVTYVEGTLRSGSYCRLRVRLDRADAGDGGPAALDDHSLLLLGTTPSGTPFQLRTRDTPDIDIRSRGEPFDLDEARSQLILALDVARWLERVDLDAATVGTDGTARIDRDENRDLLRTFEDALEQALDLFEDGDGDGRIGDDDDHLATSAP